MTLDRKCTILECLQTPPTLVVWKGTRASGITSASIVQKSAPAVRTWSVIHLFTQGSTNFHVQCAAKDSTKRSVEQSLQNAPLDFLGRGPVIHVVQ